MRSLESRQLRVRHHDDIERIPERSVREQIVPELRKLGFKHVALDLNGHVTGSMNIGLSKQSTTIS